MRREPHHLDAGPWRAFARLPGTGAKGACQSPLPGNKRHARILRETAINHHALIAERLTSIDDERTAPGSYVGGGTPTTKNGPTIQSSREQNLVL